MPDDLRLFFAHSFATEKMNSVGFPDANGVSDMELADAIADWIPELSGGRIVVVRTRDPHQNYISGQVRSDICSSDLMLCLFTKRTKDELKGRWLPSTYVISESAAGLIQYPNENQTHQRLFGLVEEGVDREQLGMAFHQNKTAAGFDRGDREGLRCRVKEIVDAILQKKTTTRSDREYLAFDKRATIWRNGAITVECRHRFRFKTATDKVKIPHAIWRVSKSLPPVNDLLNGSRDVGRGYLRCVPVDCGGPGQRTCHCRIIPKAGGTDCERPFDVEFSDLNLKAGDELTYELAWGYRDAFNDPLKQNGRPNSVGMRTGERGMARTSSMTLQFQRDLSAEVGEPAPVLDERPILYATDATLLPPNPIEFWQTSDTWVHRNELFPCAKRSGAMWETYYWTECCFRGTAKVEWIPHLNYLQLEDDADGSSRDNDDSETAHADLTGEAVESDGASD